MASSSRRGERLPRVAPPDQLASFYSLSERAITASVLGRYARAAELHGRAKAQAEELFEADSLVVASLHRGEAMSYVNQAAGMADGPERNALVRRAWAIMLPTYALLQRRIAARTLLPGSVRREEVDFQAHASAAQMEATSGPPLNSVNQLVGYSALVDALVTSLNLLGFADDFWPAAEAELTQTFVLNALDVIPRTTGLASTIGSESALVVIIEGMQRRSYDPVFRDAVLRKWRSPDVSNVLQSRKILQHGAVQYEDDINDLEARRRTDVEQIGLRDCAWPSCDKVERTVREFKQCSGCRSVWYCSPKHQMLNWGAHRNACATLDAARRKGDTSRGGSAAA